jgi:hypothetical protein
VLLYKIAYAQADPVDVLKDKKSRIKAAFLIRLLVVQNVLKRFHFDGFGRAIGISVFNFDNALSRYK